MPRFHNYIDHMHSNSAECVWAYLLDNPQNQKMMNTNNSHLTVAILVIRVRFVLPRLLF